MRRWRELALAAFLALAALPAWGQSNTPDSIPGCIYNFGPPTVANLQKVALQCDANGQLKIAGTINATSALNAASSLPTLSTGSNPFQGSLAGALYVQPAFGTASGGGTQVDSTHGLPVNCVTGCAAGTFNNNSDAVATSATNSTSAAWLYAFNGSTFDRLRDDASKNLNVNCQVGCAGGSFNNNADGVATSSTNGQAASWPYLWNGSTFDRWYGDKTNGAFVNIKNSVALTLNALPAGSNNIGAVDIFGNAGAVMDFAGQAATSPANSLQVGGVFYTAPTGLSNGQASPLQLDASARLINDMKAINGVALLAGAGATGTGAQRVTTAQDTTTIAGSAPGPAGTPSAQVVTVQGISSMTKLLVTPDSVALPANQSVNVAQVNGVTTSTGSGAVGTGSQRVAVGQDTATIAGAAPGTVASPSANVLATSDLTGSNYENKANFVSGSASVNNTTQTTIIAAPGSNKLYITDVQCFNSGATTSTITLNDGSSWEGVNPAGGGFVVHFGTPLIVGTTTALKFTPGSSSTSQICNAQGFNAA